MKHKSKEDWSKKSLTSNTLDGATRLAANLISISSKAPESLRAVDISVGNGSLILGLVNEAEVIRTGLVVFQGDCEKRLVKLALDGVEESLLCLGLHGVDRAESQAQQTIVVLILHKLLANLLGSLNGLARGLDTADNDSVFVDITTSRALVTVGNGPGSTGKFGAVVGLVDSVSGLFRGGKLAGENPTIINVSMNNKEDRSAVLRTYRSAEPVSKSKFRVVPPTLTGVRYSVSLSSGVVVAEPLSAAALTLAGMLAPYLERALAYMPGKLIVRVLVTGRTD